MKSVMVDIETLATGPGACVVSIGLAAFNADTVVASGGLQIAPAYWHGRIDGGTVQWWLQQTQDAQLNTFYGKLADKKAGEMMAEFLKDFGGDELWANDPSFDCVILRDWWTRVFGASKKFPSHYREERSCRTIYAEAKRRGVDLQAAWSGGLAHSAESDAICQAKAVILARQGIDLL